ncbi:MAG TPA: cyclophilin-like fold protein [Methylomirabilota bacterium]|nr:cyclophilin-like fold protein [Methylomirabilota bacterium]
MSRAIRISAGSISVQATLDGSRTASAIWDALPLEARVETWGEEIYFDVGLDLADESPRPVVEMGDLAYWPPGQAFCVFFGRTPASRGDECRPASPVSVFGRVDGDASVLKKVRAGTRVRVERV